MQPNAAPNAGIGKLQRAAAVQIGIELKFGGRKYPVLVGTTHVPELNQLEVRCMQCCHLLCPQTPHVFASTGAQRQQLSCDD